MKKGIGIILVTVLMFVAPSTAQAEDFFNRCDYTTKARLKELASNISSSYVPIETENGVTFQVTITNIYPGLIVRDVSNGEEYRYDANRSRPSEVTITDLQPDQTYQYDVYSDNPSCSDIILNVYYVTLPAYNAYYKDTLCIGIENYSLCNRWLKHSMSFEEFEKGVSEYRESLNQEVPKKEEQTRLNPVLQFIRDYYYVFIGLGILGIGYVVYVRRKRDSFGF